MLEGIGKMQRYIATIIVTFFNDCYRNNYCNVIQWYPVRYIFYKYTDVIFIPRIDLHGPSRRNRLHWGVVGAESWSMRQWYFSCSFWSIFNHLPVAIESSEFKQQPEGRLNIKMSSYQYINHRVKDKTVSRPLYLWHENPHTSKRRSLYCGRAQYHQ